MDSELYVGLMSGTSLDGIDACLADFSGGVRILGTYYEEFPGPLRAELRALTQPGDDELRRAALAANRLAEHYARATAALLHSCPVPAAGIRAIGCHGQTVRHRPELGFTLQLVNGALLAERTGIAVVSDFRSRDLAAGGQGAPLVPAFHAAVFRDVVEDRAVVNLGGIANITWLPHEGAVTGFDSGPANGLLDEWIERRRGLRYDRSGEWAASGRVLPALLQALAADRYFARTPPKSTGRDAFSLTWVDPHLRPEYREQDVQATLAELSGALVGDAIRHHCGSTSAVFLCGGGVANNDLVERIRRHLPGRQVESTAALGIDPDWVEALAFAWLARETLGGRPGNLATVTGAAGPRVLGCIFPA